MIVTIEQPPNYVLSVMDLSSQFIIRECFFIMIMLAIYAVGTLCNRFSMVMVSKQTVGGRLIDNLLWLL